MIASWIGLALFLSQAEPTAPPQAVLLRGGRIVPVSAPSIDSGAILVMDGRIRALGPSVEAPAGAKIVDVPKGSWILPGMVDAHSHLGSAFDDEESTESVTPEARAVEAFTSRHADVQASLPSGVTTVALAPGEGNLVGGQVGIVKLNGLRYDRSLEKASVGFKVSLGAEALRPDREPTSRTGAVAKLRSLLGSPNCPLLSAPVFVHATAAGEIESALELAAQFKLRMVLIHARQSGEFADRLAALRQGVILGPLTVGDKRSALELPGRLARAGVPLAFASDAPGTPEEDLRVSAAFAVKYGMDREAALRALTTVPAELLGLSQECGSLAPGKAADVVVWSGDPLSLTSSVELVIVGGRITWQKADKP